MEMFLTQEVEGVESEPASLQKMSSAVAEAEMPECRDHTMPEDTSQGENEARSSHNDLDFSSYNYMCTQRVTWM